MTCFARVVASHLLDVRTLDITVVVNQSFLRATNLIGRMTGSISLSLIMVSVTKVFLVYILSTDGAYGGPASLVLPAVAAFFELLLVLAFDVFIAHVVHVHGQVHLESITSTLVFLRCRMQTTDTTSIDMICISYLSPIAI